jgi:hypothetical protein
MPTTRTNDSKVDGEARSNGSSLERITVNLTPKSVEAMTTIATLTGETKTDAINAALQFYGHIREFLSSGGALYMRDAGSTELERIKIF